MERPKPPVSKTEESVGTVEWLLGGLYPRTPMSVSLFLLQRLGPIQWQATASRSTSTSSTHQQAVAQALPARRTDPWPAVVHKVSD
jgi:hypothetical protein